jgi:nucleotide-binding universal stress UspA family protein
MTAGSCPETVAPEAAMGAVLFAILVAITWVAVGMAAAVVLARHGQQSWQWYVIGVVLGPIMLPIALESVTRPGRLVMRSAGTPPAPGRQGVIALVAVDGSPEADHALREAQRVLAPAAPRFILLTVVDPDLVAGEGKGDEGSAAEQMAHELLAERASWLQGGATASVLEIAAGDPATEIMARAASEEVDLVVLGRRGRGLSRKILGSVADQVVGRGQRPILFGTPAARDEKPDVPGQRGAEAVAAWDERRLPT